MSQSLSRPTASRDPPGDAPSSTVDPSLLARQTGGVNDSSSVVGHGSRARQTGRVNDLSSVVGHGSRARQTGGVNDSSSVVGHGSRARKTGGVNDSSLVVGLRPQDSTNLRVVASCPGIFRGQVNFAFQVAPKKRVNVVLTDITSDQVLFTLMICPETVSDCIVCANFGNLSFSQVSHHLIRQTQEADYKRATPKIKFDAGTHVNEWRTWELFLPKGGSRLVFDAVFGQLAQHILVNVQKKLRLVKQDIPRFYGKVKAALIKVFMTCCTKSFFSKVEATKLAAEYAQKIGVIGMKSVLDGFEEAMTGLENAFLGRNELISIYKQCKKKKGQEEVLKPGRSPTNIKYATMIFKSYLLDLGYPEN